jgi:hypothetical protein
MGAKLTGAELTQHKFPACQLKSMTRECCPTESGTAPLPLPRAQSAQYPGLWLWLPLALRQRVHYEIPFNVMFLFS